MPTRNGHPLSLTAAIAVVAHHDRAPQAHRLMQDVGATYLAFDDGTLGATRNHRRVWQYLATKDTSYSVALEDDAVPVEGFRHQLEQVLSVAPTPVVGLYLGTGRPPHLQELISTAAAAADAQQAHWIIGNQLLHGVAIGIRTDLVTSMLDATKDSTRPMDYAIRDWANAHQHRIGFCWPSLVDHRDQPTLITHPDGEPRTQPRIAWRTGTRHEWTQKQVNL